MSITLTWWAMPVLVMVATFISGLRLFRADLIGFGVALVCSAGMGLFAALITLTVYGVVR